MPDKIEEPVADEAEKVTLRRTMASETISTLRREIRGAARREPVDFSIPNPR